MNDKRNGEGTHFYTDGSKVCLLLYIPEFSGSRSFRIADEALHFYSTESHFYACQFHGDYRNDYRDGVGMFWTPHDLYTLQKVRSTFNPN